MPSKLEPEGISFYNQARWRGSILHQEVPSVRLRMLYVKRFAGERSAQTCDVHNFWELSCINEGNMSFYVMEDEDQETRFGFTPNTIFLVPPGLRHREYSDHKIDTFWIGFQVEGGCFENQDSLLSLKSKTLQKMLYDYWLFSIRVVGNTGMELDGMLLTIIGRFFRKLNQDNRKDNSAFEEAVRYMHENYEHEISIAEMARVSSMSEGHFYREFKKVIGMPPLKYLHSIRIEKALFHLERNRLPVKEIAHLCGFKDPYYFTRAFTQTIGKSPLRYRESLRPA